ncbi:MAG: TonB family protein [Verrucomicrobia bacterium]|nr:TonB family protein [Verrucomicrobiota bacterium]
MTTRFVIPSAVAVALHALAFYGFPHLHRPADPKHAPFCPADVMRVLDFPQPAENPDATAAPRGNPDVVRTEEPAAPPPDDSNRITIPRMATKPAPMNPAYVLLDGPIGVPEGVNTLPGNGNVIPSSALDNPPQTRSRIAPIYPMDAKHDGRPGDVLVEFTVDENGRVINPKVVRSNDPVFENPTLRAIAKWRFEPGRKNGRAVRFRMALPVQYSVND